MQRTFYLFLFLISYSFQTYSQTADDIYQLARWRKLYEAQNALEKYGRSGSGVDKGKVHFLQGVIHFENYKFKQSLYELGLAHELLQKTSQQTYLGHTYLYLAKLYKDGFANSAYARVLLAKAKDAYDKIPENKYHLANVNFQIARTFPFSDLDKRAYYNGMAINFFESAPDRYTIELAECYNLQALIISYREPQSRKWVPEFLRAITLIKGAKPDAQFNLGKYYDNLGFCLTAQGDLSGYNYLIEGLNNNKRFSFNNYWVSSSLNNLGAYYEQMGKTDLALRAFKEVVNQRKMIYGDSSPEVAIGFQHIADTYLSDDNLDSAAYYFRKTIQTFVNQKDSSQSHYSPQYFLSYAFALKGKAEVSYTRFLQNRDVGLLVNALHDMQEGSKVIEYNYSGMTLESSKIAYLSVVKMFYIKRIEIAQALFELTNDNVYVQDGIEAMEFFRYASAFENQVQVRNSFSTPELKMLISRQLELSSELTLLKSLPEEAGVRKKIIQMSDELFKLSDSINSKAPVTKHQRVNLKDILSKTDDSFAEYLEDDKHIYVICLTSGKKYFNKIDKPADWENKINIFNSLISNKPNLKTFETDRMTFQQLSYSLFQILLKPFYEDIKPAKKLIIVPDGSINKIPFELLVPSIAGGESYNNLNYLFKQFEIEYAFSLRFYFSGKSGKNDFTRVLAFGYTKGKHSIPGAVNELKSIEENFDMVAFDGEQSKATSFLQSASVYPIIHLAVHGETDEHDLLKSRLIFSAADTLYAHQLYSLQLNSPLVVLSSCETALGKAHGGEGIFSMARAFLLAGASSMIVTLWKTPDFSSSLIFQEFYGLLAKGDFSGRSIQQAKLNYLKNADDINAHPFFWAGIIPIGSIETKSNNSLYYYFGAILFLLFVVGLIKASRK